MQHKRGGAGPGGLDLGIQALVLPPTQELGLLQGQLGLHGERCLGQVERAFHVPFVGHGDLSKCENERLIIEQGRGIGYKRARGADTHLRSYPQMSAAG